MDSFLKRFSKRSLMICAFVLLTCAHLTKALPAEQTSLVYIDKILVDGQVTSNPDINQVKVVRAENSAEIAGQSGLSLYANDRVITGCCTKIVLLSKKDQGSVQRLVLGENTSLKILDKSVSLSFGQIWVKVTAAFSVKTIYWTLGVPGTEFFFEVKPGNSDPQSTRANLSVLKGAVDVNSAGPEPKVPSESVGNPERPEKNASRYLRVKTLEEVDLVKGEPLPSSARRMPPEKVSYLKEILSQVDSAAASAVDPTIVGSDPSLKSVPPKTPAGWKVVSAPKLEFEVPIAFEVSKGTGPGHLSNGASTQTFALEYLTASDRNRFMFVSAGLAEVHISPSVVDLDGLATASVSQILRRLDVPSVGTFDLNLEEAEVDKLRTLEMEVSETTARSLASGRVYRFYFALRFRKIEPALASMIYIVVGCPESDIDRSKQEIAHILSSFRLPQPPRTRVF